MDVHNITKTCRDYPQYGESCRNAILLVKCASGYAGLWSNVTSASAYL